MFASETGEPLDRRYPTSRRFKALLKRTGLPSMRFHDLRHTCATLLLDDLGVHAAGSDMLGHASIGITLDPYSYVLPNMQQSTVRALEELLKSDSL